jgi:son of sevenless
MSPNTRKQIYPQHTVYARAKYDYTTDEDTSILKFHAGDRIQVIMTLESGWWDGVNGKGERGWIPSNYFERCEPPSGENERILAKL